MNTPDRTDYHQLLAVPRSKAILVHVEKFNEHSRVFNFQNKIKKVLFFFLREGIRTTFRKVWLSRKNRELEDNSVFVVAKIIEDRTVSGFQHSLEQEYYYFLPSSLSSAKIDVRQLSDNHRSLNPFIHAPATPHTAEEKKLLEEFPYRAIEFGAPEPGENNLFLIGCGTYPRTQALPVFSGFKKLFAIDFNPTVLQSADMKRFSSRSTDFMSILRADFSKTKINVGIIASYHSYHTHQAVEFLQHIPNSVVIIEKPPCVTGEDLAALSNVYDQNRIFIGYNRRFIPWNKKIKELLTKSKGPFIIQMLINEVQITPTHWYYAHNQGTRVTGNLCHWIDLAIYLLGKRPVTLTIAKNPLGIDNSVFNMLFEDGSIVCMIATEYGDGTFGVREQLTIKGQEIDITVNDYTHMRIWNRGKTSNHYSLFRDKGHDRMYRTFRKKIFKGEASEYTKEDLIYSTTTYLAFVDLYNSDSNTRNLSF